MPCFRKKRAWANVNGGRPVFNGDDPRAGDELWLPCQECVGCRAGRKADWALRSQNEAALYGNSNSFLTLTYDDEHLPVGNVLYPRHMQLFFKRLRFELSPRKIRFLYCGEYGDIMGRAHYHANIFGWFPEDAVEYPSSGDQLFTSALLSRVWPHGDVKFGRVSEGSGGYVAGHNVQKALKLAAVSGDAWRLDGRHCVMVVDSLGKFRARLDRDGKPVVWCPEFLQASNRPGIGLGWAQRYAQSLFNDSGCVVRKDGVKQRVPRFYVDALAAGLLEDGYGNFPSRFAEEFKEARRDRAMSLPPENETPERLKVREEVAIARIKFFANDKKL